MEQKIQILIKFKTKQLELVRECQKDLTLSKNLLNEYDKNEIELEAQLAVLHYLLNS